MTKKLFYSFILIFVISCSPVTVLGRHNSPFNDSADIVKGVPSFYDDTLSPLQSDDLLAKLREAKGRRIGIGDKGVIALRFDDWQNAFKKKVQPELKKRELPASMALIAGFNEIEWGSQCTWQDIRNWNRQGLEIWSHGIDHRDYADFTGLVKNIVGSRRIIEDQALKVQGFVLPGVWKYYNPRPYGLLVSSGDYDQIPGRLIQQTYALSEAYVWGRTRSLPQTQYHGADHVTISDGLVEYADIIHLIDEVIEHQTGLELMIHSGNLGLPGKLSLKDFRRVLDYIAQQRDRGVLEVLTPSGLMFADHSQDRLKLADLDFSMPYSAAPAFDPLRVINEGNNDDLLRIPPGNTSRLRIPLYGLLGRRFDGESFEVLLQCSDPNAAVTLKVHDAKGKLLSKTLNTATDAAGIKRMVFIIPPGTDRIYLSVTSAGGKAVEVQWARVQKV